MANHLRNRLSDLVNAISTKLNALKALIPTNNNQLTNGAGYLTTETDPVYTADKPTIFKYKGTIPTSGSDLDTYLEAGIYVQPYSSGASAGANYPTASAGVLEVVTPTTSIMFQRYTIYFTTNPVTYLRTRYSGTFGAWQRVARLIDLPLVSDATINIKNGSTTLGSFTTNQSAAGNIDISSAIPTNNNQLTNGAGYITSSSLPTNYVTTNSAQSGITGNKSWNGAQTFNGSVTLGGLTGTASNFLYVDAAGLVHATTLPGSSASIIVGGGTIQRAALTGDVTAAQNSNATTIANNVVTFAKMQDIPTASLIGRYSTGSGDPQSITLGSNLSLNGSGVLNAIVPTVNNGTLTLATGTGLTGGATFTANQSGNSTFTVALNAGLGNLTDVALSSPASGDLLRYNGTRWENWVPNFLTANQTITLSGDVTGSGATAISTTIANNVVTFAKMQTVPTASLLGRYGASTGNVQSITLGGGLSLNGSGVLSVTTVNEIDATGNFNYGFPTESYEGFDTKGGVAHNIKEVAANTNYTVQSNDYSILFNAASTGNVTCYLPEPSQTPVGRILIISNFNTTYGVTLNNIEGNNQGSSTMLKGAVVYIQNNGTKWRCLFSANVGAF